MPLPFATFPIPSSQLVSAFRGDYNNMLTAILSSFTGPDAPPQLFAGMLWVDTSVTPKLLKQRNTANTAWITRGQVDVDFGGALALAGGTMAGAIDMGGFAVTNLAQGSGNSAARVADLASYAKLGLGGDLAAAFAKVPNVSQIPSGTHDPTTDDELARKAYVDAKAVAGGTFTGQITMNTAPAAASNQLPREIDLENAIATHSHGGGSGQGIKLPNTSLSTAGSNESQELRSSGAGGVVWAGPQFVEFPPVQLLSHNSTVTLTAVSLSAYVPVTSRIAILLVQFRSDYNGAFPDTRYVQLELRRKGSTIHVDYRQFPTAELSASVAQTESRIQVLVPLDGTQSFEYATAKVGGGTYAEVTAWLVGYL
jgi:hypothetical protein